MLLVRLYKVQQKPNLSYSRISAIFKRNYGTAKYSKKNVVSDSNDNTSELSKDILKLVAKHDDKIYYSSVLEEQRKSLGFHRRFRTINSFLEHQKHQTILEEQNNQPLPFSLKYLEDMPTKAKESTEKISDKGEEDRRSITHFPFGSGDHTVEHNSVVQDSLLEIQEKTAKIEKEIRARQESYKEEDLKKWMLDYENFDDNLEDTNWENKYGTPDPKAKISNVPCGGCGALLHCKDTSIPGYIPSEIYKNYNKKGGVHLTRIICQRCHFLKYYNIVLQARVSPHDYPKILQTIRNKKALVVLIVDLLDFPCSIWPGIADILGEKPIVVVGNKVDLLMQDSEKFLTHVTNVLYDSLIESGFASTDIKHVELISAATGFGIESLITKLYNLWPLGGDVYLVGCTNVGKSTLFNIFLQSDYCKVQAADLIQRATTSPWPGTTLNLLKFPIARPSGLRAFLRNKRLTTTLKLQKQERELRRVQLQKTRNIEYATLIGHIDRTVSKNTAPSENIGDLIIEHDGGESGKKLAINEKHNDYKYSRWCYDTPGVIQPDQIVHLLTTEELLLVLPKKIVQPRTFCIKSKTTIFLGGLARFDYLEGQHSIRCVVFCSDSLPITICKLEEAEVVYKEYLGTELFRVPTGQPDRLQKWPELVCRREMRVVGIDSSYACADVLLSSAGWISVVGEEKAEYVVNGWTPEGRGIYLRNSLLPNAVRLRGKRVPHSPAYDSDGVFVGQF